MAEGEGDQQFKVYLQQLKVTKSTSISRASVISDLRRQMTSLKSTLQPSMFSYSNFLKVSIEYIVIATLFLFFCNFDSPLNLEFGVNYKPFCQFCMIFFIIFAVFLKMSNVHRKLMAH